MKLTSLFITVLCITFYSCSSDKTAAIDTLPEYEFVISDSIQVDHLGSLILLDIHEEKQLFLFSSEDDNRLFLTNKSGELISTFDEPGDSPTAVGSHTGSGTFLGDQIIMMGMPRFGIYDLEFNFQRGFKMPYSPSGMFYLGFDHLQPVIKGGKHKLLAFTGGAQTEKPSNQPEYYQEYNTFDLIDLDSGTFTPVVPFHPQSRFLSGEAFRFIAPIYQVRENQVSFIHKRDTLLYSYSLDHPEEFSATRIPFDIFIMNKGFPMAGKPDYETPTDREGMIHSYFKVGDLHLFIYQSGIKLNNMPDRTLDKETLSKEFTRLNPMKWIVMDDSGNHSTPQEMNKKFNLSRIDSEGNLWAAQNIYALEEEPDFVTYYKLKLVRK
ncbi:hypothetical protein SAMN04489724_3229 [Algoriphagus locisalis]|uniref:TolB-like 6-blade propeller-like n=1 Tax=Algoriphagus locisalis TaxID=305507 RepID=A0A1I7CIB0_9BACT|nr:hypothetical protein [Algoriphagus locisalis]SFT99166.1 hypothetical protein SAMN04489724_3229 [Algoriphagus locisalis]